MSLHQTTTIMSVHLLQLQHVKSHLLLILRRLLVLTSWSTEKVTKCSTSAILDTAWWELNGSHAVGKPGNLHHSVWVRGTAFLLFPTGWFFRRDGPKSNPWIQTLLNYGGQGKWYQNSEQIPVSDGPHLIPGFNYLVYGSSHIWSLGVSINEISADHQIVSNMKFKLGGSLL